jgi:hypothetical protein
MRTTPTERINDLTQRGWWGEQTLDDLFKEAVRANPEQVALVDQFNRSEFTDGEPLRLTFAEMANCAENLARTFHANGLRRDDVVILQLPNIAELAVLYFALGKLGVIISPVILKARTWLATIAPHSRKAAGFFVLAMTCPMEPLAWLCRPPSRQMIRCTPPMSMGSTFRRTTYLRFVGRQAQRGNPKACRAVTTCGSHRRQARMTQR